MTEGVLQAPSMPTTAPRARPRRQPGTAMALRTLRYAILIGFVIVYGFISA